MKERAKQTVSAYFNDPENAAAKFTVYTACEFISTAYNLAMIASNIKAGFLKTGTYPFHPNVFNKKTFGVSMVYSSERSDAPGDPWVDVHKRFFLQGASISNSAQVSRTGSLDTTANAHVTHTSVLAVLPRRHEENRKKQKASEAAAV